MFFSFFALSFTVDADEKQIVRDIFKQYPYSNEFYNEIIETLPSRSTSDFAYDSRIVDIYQNTNVDIQAYTPLTSIRNSGNCSQSSNSSQDSPRPDCGNVVFISPISFFDNWLSFSIAGDAHQIERDVEFEDDHKAWDDGRRSLISNRKNQLYSFTKYVMEGTTTMGRAVLALYKNQPGEEEKRKAILQTEAKISKQQEKQHRVEMNIFHRGRTLSGFGTFAPTIKNYKAGRATVTPLKLDALDKFFAIFSKPTNYAQQAYDETYNDGVSSNSFTMFLRELPNSDNYNMKKSFKYFGAVDQSEICANWSKQEVFGNIRFLTPTEEYHISRAAGLLYTRPENKIARYVPPPPEFRKVVTVGKKSYVRQTSLEKIEYNKDIIEKAYMSKVAVTSFRDFHFKSYNVPGWHTYWNDIKSLPQLVDFKMAEKYSMDIMTDVRETASYHVIAAFNEILDAVHNVPGKTKLNKKDPHYQMIHDLGSQNYVTAQSEKLYKIAINSEEVFKNTYRRCNVNTTGLNGTSVVTRHFELFDLTMFVNINPEYGVYVPTHLRVNEFVDKSNLQRNLTTPRKLLTGDTFDPLFHEAHNFILLNYNITDAERELYFKIQRESMVKTSEVFDKLRKEFDHLYLLLFENDGTMDIDEIIRKEKDHTVFKMAMAIAEKSKKNKESVNVADRERTKKKLKFQTEQTLISMSNSKTHIPRLLSGDIIHSLKRFDDDDFYHEEVMVDYSKNLANEMKQTNLEEGHILPLSKKYPLLLKFFKVINRLVENETDKSLYDDPQIVNTILPKILKRIQSISQVISLTFVKNPDFPYTKFLWLLNEVFKVPHINKKFIDYSKLTRFHEKITYHLNEFQNILERGISVYHDSTLIDDNNNNQNKILSNLMIRAQRQKAKIAKEKKEFEKERKEHRELSEREVDIERGKIAKNLLKDIVSYSLPMTMVLIPTSPKSFIQENLEVITKSREKKTICPSCCRRKKKVTRKVKVETDPIFTKPFAFSPLSPLRDDFASPTAILRASILSATLLQAGIRGNFINHHVVGRARASIKGLLALKMAVVIMKQIADHWNFISENVDKLVHDLDILHILLFDSALLSSPLSRCLGTASIILIPRSIVIPSNSDRLILNKLISPDSKFNSSFLSRKKDGDTLIFHPYHDVIIGIVFKEFAPRVVSYLQYTFVNFAVMKYEERIQNCAFCQNAYDYQKYNPFLNVYDASMKHYQPDWSGLVDELQGDNHSLNLKRLTKYMAELISNKVLVSFEEVFQEFISTSFHLEANNVYLKKKQEQYDILGHEYWYSQLLSSGDYMEKSAEFRNKLQVIFNEIKDGHAVFKPYSVWKLRYHAKICIYSPYRTLEKTQSSKPSNEYMIDGYTPNECRGGVYVGQNFVRPKDEHDVNINQHVYVKLILDDLINVIEPISKDLYSLGVKSIYSANVASPQLLTTTYGEHLLDDKHTNIVSIENPLFLRKRQNEGITRKSNIFGKIINTVFTTVKDIGKFAKNKRDEIFLSATEFITKKAGETDSFEKGIDHVVNWEKEEKNHSLSMIYDKASKYYPWFIAYRLSRGSRPRLFYKEDDREDDKKPQSLFMKKNEPSVHIDRFVHDDYFEPKGDTDAFDKLSYADRLSPKNRISEKNFQNIKIRDENSSMGSSIDSEVSDVIKTKQKENFDIDDVPIKRDDFRNKPNIFKTPQNKIPDDQEIPNVVNKFHPEMRIKPKFDKKNSNSFEMVIEDPQSTTRDLHVGEENAQTQMNKINMRKSIKNTEKILYKTEILEPRDDVKIENNINYRTGKRRRTQRRQTLLKNIYKMDSIEIENEEDENFEIFENISPDDSSDSENKEEVFREEEPAEEFHRRKTFIPKPKLLKKKSSDSPPIGNKEVVIEIMEKPMIERENNVVDDREEMMMEKPEKNEINIGRKYEIQNINTEKNKNIQKQHIFENQQVINEKPSLEEDNLKIQIPNKYYSYHRNLFTFENNIELLEANELLWRRLYVPVLPTESYRKPLGDFPFEALSNCCFYPIHWSALSRSARMRHTGQAIAYYQKRSGTNFLSERDSLLGKRRVKKTSNTIQQIFSESLEENALNSLKQIFTRNDDYTKECLLIQENLSPLANGQSSAQFKGIEIEPTDYGIDDLHNTSLKNVITEEYFNGGKYHVNAHHSDVIKTFGEVAEGWGG